MSLDGSSTAPAAVERLWLLGIHKVHMFESSRSYKPFLHLYTFYGNKVCSSALFKVKVILVFGMEYGGKAQGRSNAHDRDQDGVLV